MIPLSIIISLRNRRPHLEANLPNILNQDYIPYEVIVVNYKSDDRPHEYLNLIKDNKLTIVKVHGSGNFNKSKAINIGLKLAKGQVIFTLDADIYFKRLDALSYFMSYYSASNMLYITGMGNMIYDKLTAIQVRGWPECFQNYGKEDMAFSFLLQKQGLSSNIPPACIGKARLNNNYILTLKPRSKDRKTWRKQGWIPCESNWENPEQDTTALYYEFINDPERFKNSEIQDAFTIVKQSSSIN